MPKHEYPAIENSATLGDSYMGVPIPDGYLPDGVRFIDKDNLWESTASYVDTPRYPENAPRDAERRKQAEYDLASGIDQAYKRHAGVVTRDERGVQHARFYLDQDGGPADLNMYRFTTADGTVVDTMSYRRGNSWDSSQILIRQPGRSPRLIGGVTDQRTGEVLARPPGGYYGTDSSVAFNAKMWTENMEQSLAEYPSLKARARRWLGELMGRNTVQVEQPPTPTQPEKRVATPEQVEAGLARLRATVQPAVEDITAHASAGSLEKSQTDSFIHEKKWNSDQGDEYPGRLLVQDVTVAEGEWNPRRITDETPADAPRGVQVVVMRGGTPRKLQDAKGRVTPDLVLMDDGRTFYKFDDGTPQAQHMPLDKLTPADAMSIIESVESGLEEHRINP